MSVEYIKKANHADIMNQIHNLIDKLNVYTKFYDEGHPVISDKEWDDMYFELQNLENEYNIYFEDSPTLNISYQVVNKLNKVEHSHPMLSLDKTKSIDTLKSFVGNKSYIVMGKMDGLTCSLTYRKGRLVAAETRGNGIVGEDILHNALQVKNIPNRIPFDDEEYVIDGEIICDYKTFKNFSSEYKNPRNFAAGSIRLLDSKESAYRGLSFIAWDCIKGLESQTSLSGKLHILKKNFGFNIVPYVVHGNRTMEEYIEYIKKTCQDMYYPIDGVVIKYNDIEEYNAAGRTDHHFKGGIAYKFYDEEYETTLEDIEWTMGRTGQLTPVAIFTPIDIDGTEVSRASLHNISIMKELGLSHYNCKISVYKANQIIPQISQVIEDNSQEVIVYPSICPICGCATSIHKDNDSEVLYCDNPDCEGKILNQLDNFCGKKGLDIKGLSKATLEKLMNWGWIENEKDIFMLFTHRTEWIKKPGFGVASVDKILAAIDTASETTLDKVIAAAGIKEIGSRVAKDIAAHYDTWADFRKETNFLKIDGIGEVMNDNLINFVYKDIDYIVEHYLDIKSNQKEEVNNNLEGKVFCITGKLKYFKNRTELQADIENKGGKVVSSMSSKVTHLINNDNTSTSSKNLAAQRAGIPIITEEEYLQMNN